MRKNPLGLLWALVSLVRGVILVIPSLRDTKHPIRDARDLGALRERARQVGLQQIERELGLPEPPA